MFDVIAAGPYAKPQHLHAACAVFEQYIQGDEWPRLARSHHVSDPTGGRGESQ